MSERSTNNATMFTTTYTLRKSKFYTTVTLLVTTFLAIWLVLIVVLAESFSSYAESLKSSRIQFCTFVWVSVFEKKMCA